MKRTAFGLLGLKPWEFWRLTPGEFEEMVEGYNLRVEHEMHRLAWHAANIMNVHLKKKVTPGKLLGKREPMSMEERKAEFEKLKRLIERRP